ncbi:MAG: hypothetical protein LBO66_06900 [Deltaproteobacteria bacterium]|jgi:hypothetical protein|nr:hypothetical protein [Deltaproteobacteria bacterium]
MLTCFGPLTFNRLALLPSSREDAQKLKETGYGKIIFPLDEALEIVNLPFKITAPTMLEVAYWAQSSPSYELAAKRIKHARGLEINIERIRSVTNAVGKIVFDNDAREAEKALEILDSGNLIFKESDNNHILYLDTDGAMVQTRQENVQGSTWKENKLGVAFSSEYFSYYYDKKIQKKRPRVGKREYRAYVGDVENFKKHFFALALRNGYGSFRKTILLGDGATWIRNTREELFPDAQQILDYYRLSENISTFFKSVFDKDEQKREDWTEKICELLINSEAEEAKKEIISLGDKLLSKSAFNLLNYINNNEDNIDYKKYIENGYFIGSGFIESGGKSVLQQWLKRPGARWNVDCAQNMATLMAKAQCGLWRQDVVSPVLKFYGANSEQLNNFSLL